MDKRDLAAHNFRERHRAELDVLLCGSGFLLRSPGGKLARIAPARVSIDPKHKNYCVDGEPVEGLQIVEIPEWPIE